MQEQKVNILFTCQDQREGGKSEKWDGKITSVTKYGSHVEFHIESRSGFNVIAGNYAAGTFMMIEADNAGFGLAHPTDLFYNKEKVLRCSGEDGHVNRVDGITAVCALKALYDAGRFPEAE